MEQQPKRQRRELTSGEQPGTSREPENGGVAQQADLPPGSASASQPDVVVVNFDFSAIKARHAERKESFVVVLDDFNGRDPAKSVLRVRPDSAHLHPLPQKVYSFPLMCGEKVLINQMVDAATGRREMRMATVRLVATTMMEMKLAERNFRAELQAVQQFIEKENQNEVQVAEVIEAPVPPVVVVEEDVAPAAAHQAGIALAQPAVASNMVPAQAAEASPEPGAGQQASARGVQLQHSHSNISEDRSPSPPPQYSSIAPPVPSTPAQPAPASQGLGWRQPPPEIPQVRSSIRPMTSAGSVPAGRPPTASGSRGPVGTQFYSANQLGYQIKQEGSSPGFGQLSTVRRMQVMPNGEVDYLFPYRTGGSGKRRLVGWRDIYIDEASFWHIENTQYPNVQRLMEALLTALLDLEGEGLTAMRLIAKEKKTMAITKVTSTTFLNTIQDYVTKRFSDIPRPVVTNYTNLALQKLTRYPEIKLEH